MPDPCNPWAQLVNADPAPDAAAVALDRLQALATGELDSDTRRWLQRGVRAYLKAAGALTMDAALQLTPPRGARSWGRRLRQADRKLHLRSAWALVTDEVVSEYRRAHLLAAAVDDFERTYWPSWSTAGLPAGASALRSALFHAREAAGAALPATWRQLRDVCRDP